MTTENQKPSRGRKFLIVVTLLVVLVAFAGVAGMQRFIAGKKAEAAAITSSLRIRQVLIPGCMWSSVPIFRGTVILSTCWNCRFYKNV